MRPRDHPLRAEPSRLPLRVPLINQIGCGTDPRRGNRDQEGRTMRRSRLSPKGLGLTTYNATLRSAQAALPWLPCDLHENEYLARPRSEGDCGPSCVLRLARRPSREGLACLDDSGRTEQASHTIRIRTPWPSRPGCSEYRALLVRIERGRPRWCRDIQRSSVA